MEHSPSADWYRQFRSRLVRWYRRDGRSLPWRETSDAYAIWISEIMLQQTQVATVIDYYNRFLHRFPNVQTLATASEQEVLTLWAGLGYYRRARQLHAAAQIILSQCEGRFPVDFDAVRSLPGIGRYTAGAIVSFAYGTRAPILEANTIRLFSRLIALREDTKLAPSQRRLWSFAEEILPKRGRAIGELNQATMELGSLVCLPKNPNCDVCPVAKLCSARRLGEQHRIPASSRPTVFTPLQHALVVIRDQQRVLMHRNLRGGWWQGLWDFPRTDVSSVMGGNHLRAAHLMHARQRSFIEHALQQELGIECQVDQHMRTVKHGVTRYRISLYCFGGHLSNGWLPSEHDERWRWVDLMSPPELPLTSTAEKLRKWLAV